MPLPASELESVARSAWKYEQEGRNRVGRGKAVIISHSTMDRVMACGPDPMYLLITLKRYHWNRDFVLANAMAESMGWGLRKWQAARNLLVRLGIIACIHEGGAGPGDPPVYAWCDSL